MRKALGIVFLWGLVAAAAPFVILNEFGQGRAGLGEWVELLVVGEGPGTFVDLRGWTIQDYQGDSRGGVYIKFKDSEFWAQVPAGTLIVIYNAADVPNLPAHFPKDDLDPEDFLLIIPGKTGDYLEVRRWEGLANVLVIASTLWMPAARWCSVCRMGSASAGESSWGTWIAAKLPGIWVEVWRGF